MRKTRMWRNIARIFILYPRPFNGFTWWLVWDELRANSSWIYLLVRALQGARIPKLGTLNETSGSIHEDGIDIEWGGACPVQGEGEIDGHECYYRARGEWWSLDLGEDGELFSYSERAYCWPQGGWVHRDESESNIRKAVAKWRKARSIAAEVVVG